MKLLPIAGAALLALLASLAACTSPEVANNHWHAYSIVPAIERHGFGYDADRDGSFFHRLGEDGYSEWVTLRQHLLGSVYDPKNPLMGPIGKRSAPPKPPPNPYDDDKN